MKLYFLKKKRKQKKKVIFNSHVFMGAGLGGTGSILKVSDTVLHKTEMNVS